MNQEDEGMGVCLKIVLTVIISIGFFLLVIMFSHLMVFLLPVGGLVCVMARWLSSKFR